MLSPRGQSGLEAKIRGQNFGLGSGLKDLASASAAALHIWPRSGLELSLSYYVIGHFRAKIV